jgi:hypothetical protein
MGQAKQTRLHLKNKEHDSSKTNKWLHLKNKEHDSSKAKTRLQSKNKQHGSSKAKTRLHLTKTKNISQANQKHGF